MGRGSDGTNITPSTTSISSPRRERERVLRGTSISHNHTYIVLQVNMIKRTSISHDNTYIVL